MICCDRKLREIAVFTYAFVYTVRAGASFVCTLCLRQDHCLDSEYLRLEFRDCFKTFALFVSQREPFHEPILSFFHADSLYVKKTHGGIDMHRPFSSKDLPHLAAKAGWTLESSFNPAIVSWILKSFRNISEDLTISGRGLRWEQDVSWSHGPLGCYGRATWCNFPSYAKNHVNHGDWQKPSNYTKQ